MAENKKKQIRINPEDDLHLTIKVGEALFCTESLPNLKGALLMKRARSFIDKIQVALAAYGEEQKTKQERDNEVKNVDRCNSAAVDAAASVAES